MTGFSQIHWAYFCIITFNICLLSFIIRKITYKVKVGLNIGEAFPLIEYEDSNGKTSLLTEAFFEKFRLFIFLDANCVECRKVLESFPVIPKEIVIEMKIVLSNDLENISKMSRNILKENCMFVSPEKISEDFRLNSFPFFMKVDANGVISNRGYIASNNVMGSINESYD